MSFLAVRNALNGCGFDTAVPPRSASPELLGVFAMRNLEVVAHQAMLIESALIIEGYEYESPLTYADAEYAKQYPTLHSRAQEIKKQARSINAKRLPAVPCEPPFSPAEQTEPLIIDFLGEWMAHIKKRTDAILARNREVITLLRQEAEWLESVRRVIPDFALASDGDRLYRFEKCADFSLKIDDEPAPQLREEREFDFSKGVNA